NRTLGRDQFATFASGIFGRDRDIHAIAWAPRVTPEGRAELEASARADGGSFEIVELRGGTLARAPDRPEMFPALYAEPPGRQRGFDLASDPIRYDAIVRARDSGETAATQPILLLQNIPGFIIVAPVYTPDAEPLLYGVAIGGFSTDALLASATAGMRTSDLDIAITDVTTTPIPLSSTAITKANTHDLEVAGRSWRIDVARRGPIERGWPAWFALVRLLVVGLLGAVLLAITGGRTRIAAAEARNVEAERRVIEELRIADADHTFQLEVGDLLHSSESVRGVLARSAARISEYLSLDKCHFAEIDVDDAQVVVHKYTTGKKKESDEVTPLASFEASGLGELVKGTRYVIADLSKDPRTAPHYEAAYAPRDIRAFIAIPLMRGGVCVSYFGAISATPREWTQREVSLVQSVAERTWLWAEHLRALHGLRANEAQLRDLSRYLEERVDERTHELVRAVGEREALLKEIHHRVKNNLQVISSMLNLQARRITDPRFKNVFDESQQRIQTIALVHERLYQSRDLAAIGFDDYLKSLVANVMSAQNAAARNVTATTDVEGISLPIQRAIPCGLIVNELVTNALKHAFPDGRAGSIAVTMKPSGDHVELVVSDDGVGLPSSLDPAKAKTLGLDLVYTFAEQLDATVDVTSTTTGASFTLRFPAAA
ncbi:MAG: CHASE domain-containing protein, partial [Kofleriaceae bacterium]